MKYHPSSLQFTFTLLSLIASQYEVAGAGNPHDTFEECEQLQEFNNFEFDNKVEQQEKSSYGERPVHFPRAHENGIVGADTITSMVKHYGQQTQNKEFPQRTLKHRRRKRNVGAPSGKGATVGTVAPGRTKIKVRRHLWLDAQAESSENWHQDIYALSIIMATMDCDCHQKNPVVQNQQHLHSEVLSNFDKLMA